MSEVRCYRRQLGEFLKNGKWNSKEDFMRYRSLFKKSITFLTTANIRGGSITEFNAYFSSGGEFLKIIGLGCYWSRSRHTYHVTGYGTSRSLEVYLSIGYALGFKFHEIDQSRYLVI